MEFCPKCGGIIIVTDNKKAVCAGCGYKPKKKLKLQASEIIDKREPIPMLDESKERTDPIIEIKCPKCTNKKAYFWTRQTRAGDESETKFYKCTKCEHTWRVYK